MNNIWQKYAKVLVEYSVNVQKDNLVIIRGEAQAQPLILAVYEEVLKKGAHPIIRITLDGVNESYFRLASDEQLEFIDPFTKLEYDKIDKIISIGAPYNVKNMAKTNSARLAKRSAATKELSNKLLQRSAEGNLNWVICDFPTNALAQEAKMSLYDYQEFLLNACYLHLDDPVAKWKEIGKKQESLVNYMNNVKKVRITGEKTDITISTEGRKWINCQGQFNFPDGEVFTSPVENSAQGEIYFDFPAIYRGNEAQGIHLKFENGKVVQATAEKGEEFFLNMINQDEGARYLGELAFGTNDMIQEITGNILFDEKIGGSIHLALGTSYPETGGKNQSGLHWDIIKNMKNNGKIYADDKLIYENGKFLI
ncbi:MAG: peptidase M29 [Candidatus Melainabacteria bacterium RIFOXYA12_FULL_32_12]|nr:MAG: peptidase M29 [Candidatus Melainabacteria bacterium RIFOXYA12_FULL_32_12]